MEASLRRPRRPSVEDILISILTELLFSGSTLPFRVRWYSGRIIPPTYAQKHSKLIITMMRTRREFRRTGYPLTSSTHAHIGRTQSQTMRDSLLLAPTRNSSLTHPLTIISDMSAPPPTRRNSWRVYEREMKQGTHCCCCHSLRHASFWS